MPVSIDLPFPPSTNNLFVNKKKGGRYRSKGYEAWRAEAGWILKSQRPEHITGVVNVTIELGKPDNRRRDLDNLNKPILDLLVDHWVIDDDSMIQKLTTKWAPELIGCRVRVEQSDA
jgi:crossover junction endodeoxyribonuclease RusA